MANTSKPVQTSKQWHALAPYLAFLFGVLILLLVMFSNKLHDAPEQSQNARNPGYPADTLLNAAQYPNTAATSGASMPAVSSVQPDPFKAFLETHKNTQPVPPSPQPALQSPQAIQEFFKAAVEKDTSSTYPFSAAHGSNSPGK